jgi:hypothetical protein
MVGNLSDPFYTKKIYTHRVAEVVSKHIRSHFFASHTVEIIETSTLGQFVRVTLGDHIRLEVLYEPEKGWTLELTQLTKSGIVSKRAGKIVHRLGRGYVPDSNGLLAELTRSLIIMLENPPFSDYFDSSQQAELIQRGKQYLQSKQSEARKVLEEKEVERSNKSFWITVVVVVFFLFILANGPFASNIPDGCYTDGLGDLVC